MTEDLSPEVLGCLLHRLEHLPTISAGVRDLNSHLIWACYRPPVSPRNGDIWSQLCVVLVGLLVSTPIQRALINWLRQYGCSISSTHSRLCVCGVSQVVLMVKNPPANTGDFRDLGSIPGLGRSPREGNGNPLQYSCMENPMDRGAWWAADHRVTKSWTPLKQPQQTNKKPKSKTRF